MPIKIEFPPIFINGAMVGQILDIIPYLNVGPFGICTLLTAEAMGVPIPCLFIPADPWIPEDPTILIDGIPILSAPNFLFCAFGGLIMIDFPGQIGVIAA